MPATLAAAHLDRLGEEAAIRRGEERWRADRPPHALVAAALALVQIHRYVGENDGHGQSECESHNRSLEARLYL